jgi:hypothetical protein
MTHIQELKQPIRKWLALFPDERLAALFAHAQDGKLKFCSCCCLAGAINAPHALSEGFVSGSNHLWDARHDYPEAAPAEGAFLEVGFLGPFKDRRRFIIPLIRSEMWQRERRNRATADLEESEMEHARR